MFSLTTWFDALIPASIRQMSQPIASSRCNVQERFSCFSSLSGSSPLWSRLYSGFSSGLLPTGNAEAHREVYLSLLRWPGAVPDSNSVMKLFAVEIKGVWHPKDSAKPSLWSALRPQHRPSSDFCSGDEKHICQV